MHNSVNNLIDDTVRINQLREAQSKAILLFDEVIERNLIQAGWSELAISDSIRALATEMFDITKFWHKRIVRAGANTLEPYKSNPPDRLITEDDIVFLDFGPIFGTWEADLGRTYVLGNDPIKHKLAAALPEVWYTGKNYFEDHPEITGDQLFYAMQEIVHATGWQHAPLHYGHLVGEFPHEKINGHKIDCYITRDNHLPLRRLDPVGQPCHWILEVHLVDKEQGFGGFYEQLLDI